ncbi:uncharacterized protein LOC141885773 isoform X3 [Acropora palmata]|uniref:uncharacterized protein LOC141885773 isoform X3 n=1 Tax=Acropora palmata TaxID=6131 RepID=UPI003D9FFEDD
MYKTAKTPTNQRGGQEGMIAFLSYSLFLFKASTSQGGGQECIIAFLTHLLVKILLKPTRKSRTETAKVTQ